MFSKYFTALMLVICIFSCSNSDVKTFYVTNNSADCKSNCLEIKANETDEWQKLNTTIEGFTAEAGLIYVLFLETKENEDGTTSYALVDTVKKYENPSYKIGQNSWKVIGLGKQKEFNKTPWMTFSMSENKVNGFAGCNTFFGKFHLNDNTISFENMGSTKMMCPDIATEDSFFNLLYNVKSYEFVDNVLHFMADDNTVLMKFEQLSYRK
ncbi:META domain-containing protein [Pontimicrobium sp. IMCC45349]|uniref:META domain-containing protein n=1 Tax=Pontimicrobium sp. IMCC45349 TaxID=3391574 RepID=UPI0039A376CD